jgi:DNA-binding SARP family transcriptional activator/tetratricopeptide (TPR) repeat protein
MIELRTLGTLDLHSSGDIDLGSLLRGPKRVALLTYLAIAAPSGFHRRDTLLAIFWPECRERQARSSLRNTLHVLRRFLGPDVLVNRGDEEVGIAGGALWCDAVAFREAYGRGQFPEALELYRGELLPGFFVPDAPGFAGWLAGERDTLHRAAFDAAWTLAETAEHEGHAAAAALRARQALGLCSLDEEAVCRLIRFLDRVGDRAGALAAYEGFSQRLRAEFDSDPAPETRALDQEIRSRHHPHHAEAETQPHAEVGIAGGPVLAADAASAAPVRSSLPPPPAAPISSTPPEAGPISPPARRRSWSRYQRRFALAGVALLLGGLIGIGVWPREAPAADRRLVLAVGEVEAFGGSEDAGLTRVLPDMLATNLARAEAVRVISATRLHEVRAGLGDHASLAMAARAAGADELLEGSLVRQSNDLLRLDLRRIDLRTGDVRAVYRAAGADPFELVDRATAELLVAFGVSPPANGIASVTTPSVLAYRLYEEGVRAHYEGDSRTAQRFLTAALGEDSLFAMAAYYRAETRRATDHAAFRNELHRAARLAGRASDRERLLIRNAWAQAMDEPAQLALAESLVVRFPTEPDGHLFLGKARLWSGEFLSSLPHLRRAVEMDSISLAGGTPRCLACDAMGDIVTAYLLADSLPAAEREARRWTQLQPGSARSWHALGSTLEYQNRLAEAKSARGQAVLLGSNNPRDPLYPIVLALRAGDFQRADRLLAERDAPGESLVQQNVLWYRVLSLRSQGRLSEALVAARQYRQMVRDAATTGHPPVWAAVLEAQVQFEAGEFREAAALWRAMADAEYEPDSSARSARHRAWTLTHAASALAAAGDTVRLTALADSIATLGSQSAYGRDPRLHHHVRGLLLGARGDARGAAAAHQQAMFSTTSGYGRINLELGRALLALGQPRRAAEVLSAGLRGPLDAANLYVSRTELHEMAGQAWEAAGRSDQAAVHYRWVAEAWRSADPSFAARRENVQRRLARLAL